MGCPFWDKLPGDAMASAEVNNLVASAGFGEKLSLAVIFLDAPMKFNP